ncbi:hypothetical protein CC1G_07244 [Coprinopsis cinerea okayama7|uniref:Uncharacterized protein n=1 Tax=Coprinopsis cinerea (strain Okayama-7 / 130 / ATCC MYA-4618 / FGSC 9003) TaxID=240176 RepID=A8PD27_COPC7|nr:hypothetical protein CC1G_07244 [Coprinopsis cinerea okayama7\|eukprot:XP_001840514.1 hypothetical protein CC1G_07244 [Coprinopsis cinerea okayama7\
MSDYPPEQLEFMGGWDALVVVYIPALASLAVAAVELFMCFYGLALHLEIPKQERTGRGRYVVASFVLTGLAWTTAIAQLISAYFILLDISPPPMGGISQVIEKQLSTGMALLRTLPFVMQRWIGDILLVFRCYMIWHGRAPLAVIPMFTFLVSFGLSIAASLPIAKWEPTRDTILISIDAFVYTALHISVTTLITIRLLRARRNLVEILGGRDDKLYTHVIAMLVESAAAIVVFAIPRSIIGLARLSGTWGASEKAGSIVDIGYYAVVVSISSSPFPHAPPTWS